MDCEFMCDDGVARMLDMTAEATAPFNCVLLKRVRTPKGEAVILGVNAGKLYVLLDSNASALVATAFTRKDFEDGLLEVLPELPAVVDPLDSHRVKKDVFCGRSVCLVTQDQNGPCPVVAAANALTLMGRINLCPGNCRRIEAKELRRTILEYIIGGNPDIPQFVCPTTRVVNGEEVATIAGLVQERLAEARAKLAEGAEGEEFLRRLYHGMSISPIFSVLDGFDSEDDLMLFALAGLRLVHGWMISSEDRYAPLRDMSFNEVSLLAIHKNSELSGVANEFLEHTRSQLTDEGLAVLLRELDEGEVVVLFWNNHFSTAVKLGGRLLLLLSDEAYADRSSILFEAIEDVHGAATFTDGDGADADALLLAVQSLTGNEFAAEAVSEARNELQTVDGKEPSPEEVVSHLRDKDKAKKDISPEWAPWVREGAHDIVEMGFDISHTDACELVQRTGSVSVAVSELCKDKPEQ
ncbi:protein fam63a [Trypanosoma rangeli]|uniref:Protein fam63a n=1 Tax=Trypanosoma rangeli TaxID=5698 RepID=A0A422P0P4_TRYRA|nr:protein fam63a [Trypanosoma rangeli]RNF11312.1 protein fam63a [Trypanosoma rangeli]|eukprot:RNF11312.1 protein fam63a [Trypanosoma rangeli]